MSLSLILQQTAHTCNMALQMKSGSICQLIFFFAAHTVRTRRGLQTFVFPAPPSSSSFYSSTFPFLIRPLARCSSEPPSSRPVNWVGEPSFFPSFSPSSQVSLCGGTGVVGGSGLVVTTGWRDTENKVTPRDRQREQ